jgi:hypothetical protein
MTTLPVTLKTNMECIRTGEESLKAKVATMTDKRQGPAADDWRRRGQEKFLAGKKLVFHCPFKKYSEQWDHEHCRFCWATISESAEDMNEGYATEDERCWVCPECFEDFKNEFQWTVDA